MKKFISALVLLSLGFVFLALNHEIALKARKILYKNELVFSQAVKLLKENKIDMAEEEFKKIVLDGKSFAEIRSFAFFNMGNIALSKASGKDGRALLKNAVFYFQEALRINPLLWSAKFNLDKLLKMGLRQQNRPLTKKIKEHRANPKTKEERSIKPYKGRPVSSGLP